MARVARASPASPPRFRSGGRGRCSRRGLTHSWRRRAIAFFAIDGTPTDGISWVPTTVDGMPAFEIVPGELGLGMIRASHSFRSSCVEAGLDQVIDDVWVIPEQPTWLERTRARSRRPARRRRAGALPADAQLQGLRRHRGYVIGDTGTPAPR